MEKSKKYLKICSILMLVFAGLTILNLAAEIIFGELNSAEIPEGAPDNILLITKIFLMSFSFLLTLPQIYLGIKGVMIAKNPDSSQKHIILAMVLLGLLILGLISPAISIVKKEDVGENVSNVLSVLVEILIYIDYIQYARAVAKGK